VSRRRGSLYLLNLAGIAFMATSWCLPAHAQRVTQLDGAISVSGGLSNYPTNTLGGGSSQSEGFYNVSPSANVSSRTARSTLGVSYAFGWNYYDSELARHSTSHTGSLSLSREFSPRWNIRVSDYYNRTNDVHTFYALRGFAVEEEAIVVYFYPVTTNASLATNALSVSFDHTLSPKSTLAFGASHSIGFYPGVEGAPLGLSDLQTISANASFTRRLNERTSVNVGYNGSYFSFDKFNSAVSTAVTVGLSSEVAKNTTVSASAGPSRVNNLNIPGSNTSLVASLSIAKTIKENNFHASISNNNATTSGVGTVSNTRTLSAGISRNLGRRVDVFADFSAFDGTGVVGNPYRTRGTSATANMGYRLAKNLFARGGIQYQRYTQPSPYAYTQRQLFASLQYTHPNLLRSH
jgi:hypothetical protein